MVGGSGGHAKSCCQIRRARRVWPLAPSTRSGRPAGCPRPRRAAASRTRLRHLSTVRPDSRGRHSRNSVRTPRNRARARGRPDVRGMPQAAPTDRVRQSERPATVGLDDWTGRPAGARRGFDSVDAVHRHGIGDQQVGRRRNSNTVACGLRDDRQRMPGRRSSLGRAPHVETDRDAMSPDRRRPLKVQAPIRRPGSWQQICLDHSIEALRTPAFASRFCGDLMTAGEIDFFSGLVEYGHIGARRLPPSDSMGPRTVAAHGVLRTDPSQAGRVATLRTLTAMMRPQASRRSFPVFVQWTVSSPLCWKECTRVG